MHISHRWLVRTLTHLGIMSNSLNFSGWKLGESMPWFPVTCKWHALHSITELLHPELKKKVGQSAKTWRFLWECRNVNCKQALSYTSEQKERQCNCHRTRVTETGCRAGIQGILSKSAQTGWGKEHLREQRLHSPHKMARSDGENKPSAKTNPLLPWLGAEGGGKWHGCVHAISRSPIKPGERRPISEDTLHAKSTRKWKMELKTRVVIIWPSTKEQIGGREKMHLVGKKIQYK